MKESRVSEASQEVKIWVALSEGTCNILTYMGVRPPADKIAIPYPANIKEFSFEDWSKGITIPNAEGWSIFACRVPGKDVEFNLVDRDGICEVVTYKHIHHAIYYASFSAYKHKVKVFEERVENLSKKIKELISRMVFLQDNLFLSYDDRGSLVDELKDVERNFLNWIDERAPHRIRLKLANVRYHESLEIVENVETMLDILSTITMCQILEAKRIEGEIIKAVNLAHLKIESLDSDGIKTLGDYITSIGTGTCNSIIHKSLITLTENDKEQLSYMLVEKTDALFRVLVAKKEILDREVLIKTLNNSFNLEIK